MRAWAATGDGRGAAGSEPLNKVVLSALADAEQEFGVALEPHQSGRHGGERREAGRTRHAAA